MLKISSNFKPGEIVLLELPFSDLSGSKLRPVLVISNDNFNSLSKDLIVLKITGSYFNNDWEIKITDKNLDSGKLKKTSYIDTGFIFTIEKSSIRNKIAEISPSTLLIVTKKLVEILC